MTQPWRDGNRVQLLKNGEEYYPRVFEAMARARRRLHVEAFIVMEDSVGLELQRALIAAAQRGVAVTLLVDGYGSQLSGPYVSALTEAGVQAIVYDPQPRVLGVRTNVFRRLHRKIVLIDHRLAFVGGLNFSRDHLREFGPTAKQDYAVEVEGPVVEDLCRLFEPGASHEPGRHAPAPASGAARILLATRDNRLHRSDIEREYRAAIRAAREEVILANAYFFPGRGFLRELRDAARRGVRVVLILQGNPDRPIMKWAARALYDELIAAGAEIHEYLERPLHGKVAVIDGEWATVGSSNLDPLSLSLNLEANLFIRDRGFGATLREHLAQLIRDHCRRLAREQTRRWGVVQRSISTLAYHALRYYPSAAGWWPGHVQPVLQALPHRGDASPSGVWRSVRRMLALGTLVLGAVLVHTRAREIGWAEVAASLEAYRVPTLLLAALATLGSFALYSCFDLVGRAYTRHRVSRQRVLAIAFASYAFNLNLGAWVGAIALRFRLYSRLGLRDSHIAQILGVSLATNWLGYLAIGGTVFLLGGAPERWATPLGSAGFHAAGALMLLAVLLYLALCAGARRRNWRVRGHAIHLPSLRMALAQLALSAGHWLLMAAVIFLLLRGRIDYPDALGALLISSVAAIVVHVPAGLGVIEAVFLTLLGPATSQGLVLAALLAYRGIFYLGPLLVGVATYLLLETLTRRRQGESGEPRAVPGSVPGPAARAPPRT